MKKATSRRAKYSVAVRFWRSVARTGRLRVGLGFTQAR
jgi:hypothetical protein